MTADKRCNDNGYPAVASKQAESVLRAGERLQAADPLHSLKDCSVLYC